MRYLFLCAPLLFGCGNSPAEQVDVDPPAAGTVRLQPAANGLEAPVDLQSPAGDDRLFVVEQSGRIRMIEDGALRAVPFLDITSEVGSGGERGLLGLAFHPSYAGNGFFFVNFTDRDGNTQIRRYHVSADPDVADRASAVTILSVDQPFANHNGGQLAFGPDGMLYIGLGDGGSGGDPRGNGQNLATLLGSLLRIDIDSASPYGIPADNPFIGRPGARPEIWASGLRNPWRFSFDRSSGQLYVADVGQNSREEVNVVDARAAGINYGWNVMEGKRCFTASSCDISGLTLPVLEYDHGEGCSITGGFVYRGTAIPSAIGHYFYSDYCAGWIRSFVPADGQVTMATDWALDAGSVLSFGQDASGELYVLTSNGTVFRLAPVQ